LTFANGETSKTFTVGILNSGATDGQTRTVGLELTNPTGGATLGSANRAVLNITVRTAQPAVLNFSTPSPAVAANARPAPVTVHRTGSTSGAVSVNFATSDGTAHAGVDYTAASGTLNFADGEASKTFTVAILNSNPQASRTVTVTLSAPTG